MTYRIRVISFLVALAVCATHDASATNLVISGRTASIGNGFIESIHPEGSHFHTSNLSAEDLPAGNPSVIDVAGVAEVGGFFGDEDVRGVSEFDIRNRPTATGATLLFDVFDLRPDNLGVDPIGGLFGQEPLDGTIDVYAFNGDNVESVADYAGNLIQGSPIASLSAASLTAGETISVSVTDIYNKLVSDLAADPGAPTAFGVRLQNALDLPDSLNSGAVTFSNFRLEVVPEPSGMALFLIGLLPFVRRRKCS